LGSFKFNWSPDTGDLLSILLFIARITYDILSQRPRKPSRRQLRKLQRSRKKRK